MKKLLLIHGLMLLAFTSIAQHTMEGKIEYERKTNLHRTIDQMDKDRKEWIEKFRSKIPKHKVEYFDMYFNNQNSVYKPGREAEQQFNMWFSRTPASENVVYTDFNTKKVIAQKQVYEEKFLVKDTMRKIEWKIMDEVRTIANYKCRKALGKMYDSVYVVAFYTDDIPASGGPEMFGGLPGMVLEVAIPRLHTVWIATKVDYAKPDPKEMTPPKKGKEVTQKEMYDVLSTSLDRWGDYKQKAIWWSML